MHVSCVHCLCVHFDIHKLTYFSDVVELLVSREADLDLGANSPLMEAAQEGHLDVVKFLIQETVKDDDLSVS